jgi:penicillin-binding protein 2
MINKKEGIAIEPKTGEILAPSPHLPMILRFWLVDNVLKTILIVLRLHCKTTLRQRGLLAEYPPGSPFKILTGLIGPGRRIDEQTTFMCHHGFSYAAGRFMKCHGFGHTN